MVNLPTKFEVSTFSRYGDMCAENAQNGGVVRDHPRSSAMSSFDRAHTISYSSIIETIGCSNDNITWFWNYLTDRQQRVITYEQVTEWMAVSRGFPQGSGISPLLFNIFIKRLPRHCISSTLQFADDTTLAVVDPSFTVVAQNLTASFPSVKEFCDSHELIFFLIFTVYSAGNAACLAAVR